MIFARSIAVKIFVMVFFALIAIPACAAPVIRSVEATVEYVYDGDTIRAVTKEGTELRVRLAWIDAPETAKPKMSLPSQPFGNEATEYLKKLVLGKKVTLHIVDIDRHRRMVAIIMIGKTNVNLAMIQAGAGECYREYMNDGPEGRTFLAAEDQARRARRGIWSQEDYMRPSEFRRQNKVR